MALEVSQTSLSSLLNSCVSYASRCTSSSCGHSYMPHWRQGQRLLLKENYRSSPKAQVTHVTLNGSPAEDGYLTPEVHLGTCKKTPHCVFLLATD